MSLFDAARISPEMATAPAGTYNAGSPSSGFWDTIDQLATASNPMLGMEGMQDLPAWMKLLSTAKVGVQSGDNWFGVNAGGGGQNAMMGEMLKMLKAQSTSPRNSTTVTPLETRAERSGGMLSVPIPDLFGGGSLSGHPWESAVPGAGAGMFA